jgi:hypothetical protein
MTYARGSSTCDVCGEEINEDRAMTRLADRDGLGCSFHWCCFWSVWDQLVSDTRAESDELEDIPTLEGWELRQMRGRHRMPDGRLYGNYTRTPGTTKD